MSESPFYKTIDLRPGASLKIRHFDGCFPENFVKFLRTHFL